MPGTIKKNAAKIGSLVKMVGINTITPFTEKPSSEKALLPSPENASKKEVMGANDLFAQFTANIINEQTVFTR